MIIFLLTCATIQQLHIALAGNCSHQCYTGVEFDLALNESSGFFIDITNSNWKRMRNISQSRVHNMIGSVNGKYPHRSYYQSNWDPDFSCLFEDSIGGNHSDGHKWICDPYRIAMMPDCLVYSIGSSGDFIFEVELFRLAPKCEIHTFDPGDYSSFINEQSFNISYHEWGIQSSRQMLTDPKFKSLPETLRILGHVNRRIDILKIDCEGCEWEVYRDILQIDARQIVVEVHYVNEKTESFFTALHENGYVIFHKEPNLHGCSGDCVEFSFLKLSTEFVLHRS
jgi:Methyltransferase domain